MASYEFRSVRLSTGSGDTDGRLVFIEGNLAAVIVLLADEAHGDQRGLWSMEADFRIGLSSPPLFNSPYEAVAWLRSRDRQLSHS